MPIFEIRLLGTPTVKWDGAPVSIVRRQTRLLLYRLAMPGPAPTRDQLCFLFWPDVAESISGRNLSHLLTHLRHALPDGEVLLAVEDQVFFDAGMVWTDAGEFLRLRRAQGEGADLDRLTEAAALYRGPFLDGVCASGHADYESWMTLERRTLERRYRDTLHALVDLFAQRGDYDEAIRYAHRYLEIDGLDETIHQRLIRLYAQRGNRAAALQTYEQFADLLQRELGVSPLPETQSLYETLCSRPESLTASSRPVCQWTTLPGPRLPLTGRDDSRQVLQRLFARAAAGEGSVALVTGEAGIGKSRLLEQFVTESSARALAAAGRPGVESLPFHVLIQAIRPHLRVDAQSGQLLNARLQSLPPVWLAEAARLLPELSGDTRISTVSLPDYTQAGFERSQLFECLSRIVMALVEDDRPGVVCLDDLQWADDETIGWLAYFASRLQRAHVLALCACRVDEGRRLASLRRALSRLGLLTEIRLGALGETDVARLLRNVAGEASSTDDVPDAGFAARVTGVTGGNPYCVVQIATALKESGIPPHAWGDVQELPAPASLCTAVGARLDELDPASRQVVEACSVLAPSFGFDMVRLTSGRRELETLDSLEKLVMCGFLESNGAEYRFHQELTRRVLVSGMSPMRRRLLHRRAGRALEQINRYALDALAHHYEAGNEPAKADHFRQLAAQRAEALLALQEAEERNGRESVVQPQ